ncbi:zinc transporter ZntB [Oricola cellulosilytica]|uniref:Zinc transporter ZntB n=1 Tax=Oricola cellulosilytica TaxID=1429082 RepID=A0A4V2MND0_9HYPH|nr:zinc transporter ZntB [Oricola cellulosilytica]TCD12320.1 zinc transporter ZntB [Oricola cellulosilytica]
MQDDTSVPAPRLEPGGTIALEFDGKGGSRFVAEAASNTAAASGGFTWVHIHRDALSIEELLQDHDCDEFVRDALTADDTRPRCTVHGDGAIVIMRGVNLNPGAEPDDMVSVRFWIEDSQVIGVWVRPLLAIEEILAATTRGQAPRTPGDLIAKVALRLADRTEPVVTDLSEQIDALEERVAEDLPPALRRDLAEIRRDAINLRRFMFPQRDALTTLEIEDLEWLGEHERSRIREAASRTTRLAEELDAIRDRAAIVYDEIMDRRSEVMNRNMLYLAIVAVIFLPLGLITGLLGINVGGIPGQDSPNAFWFITAILLGIAVIELAILRVLRLF